MLYELSRQKIPSDHLLQTYRRLLPVNLHRVAISQSMADSVDYLAELCLQQQWNALWSLPYGQYKTMDVQLAWAVGWTW